MTRCAGAFHGLGDLFEPYQIRGQTAVSGVNV